MAQNELKTNLVTLSIATNLQPSPDLQKKLDNVKQKADYTNQLLKEYREDPDKFMENNDEESIAALTKEIDVALAVYQEEQLDRKDIKKFLDEQSKTILALYDKAFEDNNLTALENAKRDINSIKTELQFRRKNARWAELEPVFQNTITNYPNIAKYVPDLTDFSKFRVMNEKLVSGAKKQSPVMNTIKKNVREMIADMNAAIDLIIANSWELLPEKQTQLVAIFKQTPTSAKVLQEAPALKQQQEYEAQQAAARAAELERQRIAQEEARKEAERKQKELQEQQRLAKLQQDALAQEALKRRQEQIKAEQAAAEQRARELADQAAQAKALADEQARIYQEKLKAYKQSLIAPGIADKYPLYIEDLFRRTNGQSLHANDRAKATELYTFMTALSDPQSVAYQSTQADPGRTLELARFIIDL